MSPATSLIQVRDIRHLQELCQDNPTDFRIALRGGAISRKNVSWYGSHFSIYNGIDGSVSSYTPERLEKSFIGDAIRAGAFHAEP